MRFVASRPGSDPEFGSPEFTTAMSTPDAEVRRFDDPLPRVAIYARVAGAASVDSALRVLATPAFDVRREAVVVADNDDARAAVSDLQSGRAAPALAGTLLRYTSNDVVASVDAPERALAVLNDTDYPGWRAAIDGRDVPIVRANGLFRGVELPAGRHVLEFRYRPASFAVGVWLSVAGVIIAAALMAASTIGRARGQVWTARARQ